MYFKALTEGLVKIPKIPLRFRQQIRHLHKKIGPEKFFLRLIKHDPISKKHLNSSDTQRVIRAYEIKAYTKKSMYNWFKNTKSDYEQNDFYKIYIDFPRNDLLLRISKRSKEMMKKGAIPEVKNFINLKVPLNKTSSKAIGIEELKDYLNKKIEIEDVIEKISIKTRQYAKRQTTWGRGNMSNWNKINPNSLNKFLKKI